MVKTNSKYKKNTQKSVINLCEKPKKKNPSSLNSQKATQNPPAINSETVKLFVNVFSDTSLTPNTITKKTVEPIDHFVTPIEPPARYWKDRIILLIIDPTFVYVYWEIKPETFSVGKSFISSVTWLCLRVYDVTNVRFNGYNANTFWDIPVSDQIGNWYIRLESSDRVLVIDVGLKNNMGDFYPLVRSNFAQLPRNSVVTDNKILWMLVNEVGQIIITETEDLTDEDIILLKKMLGRDWAQKLSCRNASDFLGSSNIKEIIYEHGISKVSSSNLVISGSLDRRKPAFTEVSYLKD